MIANITSDAPGKLRGLGNDQTPPLVSGRRNTSSPVIDNTTPTGPPDAGLPSAAAANFCRLCLVLLLLPTMRASYQNCLSRRPPELGNGERGGA